MGARLSEMMSSPEYAALNLDSSALSPARAGSLIIAEQSEEPVPAQIYSTDNEKDSKITTSIVFQQQNNLSSAEEGPKPSPNVLDQILRESVKKSIGRM